jgi:hypothetical protein
LAVVAGLRGNVGYDTCNYKELYATMGDMDYEEIWYIEPGFVVLNLISNIFFNEPQIFLFLFAVAQGVLLYFIAKKIRNPSVFLILFISTFYYSFFLSMIRQGLATLILCFAYILSLRGDSRWYISLLAPTLHISVLPVLVIIKPILKPVLILFALLLIIMLFGMDSMQGLSIYKYFHKAEYVFSGGYYVEHDVSWHVYLSYVLMLVVVILTAGKWQDVIIYTILIPVMMVADIYFFKSGRIANVALPCLCVLHGDNWHLYSPTVKKIALVYYFYLAFSMTAFPIIHGDGRVLGPLAEQVRTQAGNYHLWLFNNKDLCPY